jgi:transposase-like protein
MYVFDKVIIFTAVFIQKQKASQFRMLMKYNFNKKTHFKHYVECLNPLITTKYQGNLVAD